jgi:lauroyl/myristoyl acyltransferase
MQARLSTFIQKKTFIYLYLTLGWEAAKVIIFFLGRLYFFLNREEKRRIFQVFDEVMARERPSPDLEKTRKKIIAGIFAHYYEKMFIAFEEPRKASRFLHTSILDPNSRVLLETLGKKKGVLMVTGHYGAIEFIPTLLAVKGFPVSMIAKFKTERLKKKIFAQAEKYRLRMIDASQNGGVIQRAIQELRENRILVTECDEMEEWRPSGKETISFLGQRTGLDRTINTIRKRSGAEIVFALIHRFNLNQYQLRLYTYEDMQTSLKNTPVSVGETVLKFLEQQIYAHPEQWYQWATYAKIRTKGPIALEGRIPSYVPLLKSAAGRLA